MLLLLLLLLLLLNPAGANEILMGTLRQRGMKQIGEDWIRLDKIGEARK